MRTFLSLVTGSHSNSELIIYNGCDNCSNARKSLLKFTLLYVYSMPWENLTQSLYWRHRVFLRVNNFWINCINYGTCNYAISWVCQMYTLATVAIILTFSNWLLVAMHSEKPQCKLQFWVKMALISRQLRWLLAQVLCFCLYRSVHRIINMLLLH